MNSAPGSLFSPPITFPTGIDLAGRNKMHYPATVLVVTVPCSSAIKPRWIFHALVNGFDGVFIAADGGDCSYVPDCTKRTGRHRGRRPGAAEGKIP